MYELLKDRFDSLINARVDQALAQACWQEIAESYGGKSRVYHNLTHLKNLFAELEQIREDIEDWETLSWSVFFHDLVYNVRKQDNEELSAEAGVKWLKAFNFPQKQIILCKAQIIATKSHAISADHDTNLFTDADLSILGQDWETYQTYFKAIRKEYRIYPNLMYKPARKKVLKHFLEMPKLFKTAYFQGKYETQARQNLEREIGLI